MQLTRTVRVEVAMTPEQSAGLLLLIPRVTAAFNQAALYAFEHPECTGAIPLQKALYATLRAQHALKSQFTCQVLRDAMGAVATVRKRAAKKKKVSAPHSERRSIPYDARSMTLWMAEGRVSFATDGPRITCALRKHRHLASYADWSTDAGKLAFDRGTGRWWLSLSLTKDVPDPKPSTSSVLGCDRGIVIPAALSNGKTLGDSHWHSVDRQYAATQRSLQAKGTPSAKRRLQRRAGKWSRFRSWCDHVTTSQILAQTTPGTTLVLEDLTNIRTRAQRFRGDTKRRMHAWSFRRQQDMLAYKAPAVGVAVVYVDARYTSQKCSCCGHVAKKNRRTRERFVCQSCGHEAHADLNAARNIAANWEATQQNGLSPVGVSPPHAVPVQDTLSAQAGGGQSVRGTAKSPRRKPRGPKPHPQG